MNKKSKSDWLLLRVSRLAVVSAWRPRVILHGLSCPTFSWSNGTVDSAVV